MRIAVYAFDGITMFHLAVPQLVFGEVGRLGLATGWTTVLWSTTGGEITTAEGYRIGGLHGPEVTSAADLVIVPSWPETAPALGERSAARSSSARTIAAPPSPGCASARSRSPIPA